MGRHCYCTAMCMYVLLDQLHGYGFYLNSSAYNYGTILVNNIVHVLSNSGSSLHV